MQYIFKVKRLFLFATLGMGLALAILLGILSITQAADYASSLFYR